MLYANLSYCKLELCFVQKFVKSKVNGLGSKWTVRGGKLDGPDD